MTKTNDEMVAVAGATGNAGQEIVRALHEKGHRVCALVRSRARLQHVEACCQEVRIVQVTDRRSVRRCLDCIDRVVSALGKTWQKDKVSRRIVDVETNLNMVEEAQRVEVKRFGLVRVAMASTTHPVAIIRMKGEVEQELKRSGVPLVIVQPSRFFSDIWKVFQVCSKGTFWVIGDGRVRFNPISLVDLGRFVPDSLFDETKIRKIATDWGTGCV